MLGSEKEKNLSVKKTATAGDQKVSVVDQSLGDMHEDGIVSFSIADPADIEGVKSVGNGRKSSMASTNKKSTRKSNRSRVDELNIEENSDDDEELG